MLVSSSLVRTKEKNENINTEEGRRNTEGSCLYANDNKNFIVIFIIYNNLYTLYLALSGSFLP